MRHSTLARRTLLAAGLAGLVAAPALAHHGWVWTTDEPFVLEGEIQTVYLGNPHGRVDIVVDGDVWVVELAPPRATARSGFVDGVAEQGDQLTAYGFRSNDASERRMKAVRVEVNGNTYDVYPRRTQLFDS